MMADFSKGYTDLSRQSLHCGSVAERTALIHEYETQIIRLETLLAKHSEASYPITQHTLMCWRNELREAQSDLKMLRIDERYAADD